MITEQAAEDYFVCMAEQPAKTKITERNGRPLLLHNAFGRVINSIKKATYAGKKIMFIGNGGSAGIASHFAIDYSKNGKMRSIAFNDAVALTCAANDYGYENGFSSLIDIYADKGDILIAISSSGNSQNILNAAKAADNNGCEVFTFSGFSPDNSLRKLGNLNFYVPAKEYGFVECTHMSLLHGILDLSMGIVA